MTTPKRGFPSLIISQDRLEAQGSFAEAQAAFLQPSHGTIATIDRLLQEKNIGVVAHFYMDPELQGVLSACSFPHIHISDSLLMADKAIAMADAGVKTIVVLGVDFMSENVRAMLDAAGHDDVEVLRVAENEIGCSLAESAEALAYGAYLKRASEEERALHVVYINTSLLTKAKAHAMVPTITCTSSNVVNTVLTAFAEVEDLHVYFGPDTYMGHNLRNLFESLQTMPEETIQALHPAHDQASIASLLPRFHTFEQGTCIVHHMFGQQVVDRVKEDYGHAFVTAHLEVPGEMFALAMEAKSEDRGVVGSTSNILSFIEEKVDQAKATPEAERRLSFVLGTEAGMITSIVRSVQKRLAGSDIEVEIVFPVAEEAIAQSDDPELGIVPGVSGGEGCSTAGGCATCPYMKMNSLEALKAVLESAGASDQRRFHPRLYQETIQGRTAADLGGEPILHMRAFQATGHLPDALVEHIST